MRQSRFLSALLVTLATTSLLAAACRQGKDPPTARRSTAGRPVAAKGTPPPPPRRERRARPRYVDLDKLAGKTVVLVTHPMPHVLGSIREVFREKLHDQVPNLHVVGVFHGDEQHDYRASFAYLRKHRSEWLGLTRIGCALKPADLYRKNDCTPTFERLLTRSRGIIFTGGADIPPALYGEKTKLLTVIRTPQRQYWEISLLFHLLGGRQNPRFTPLLAKRPDYPVLGICMGMQAMNVATGGTLHQDILADTYGVQTFEDAQRLRADLLHRNVAYYLDPKPGVGPGVYHPLRFVGAKRFWQRLAPDGKPVKVMSIHHQSLDRIGEGLEVIATSVDGKVVEAVRHRRFASVLGVQFHPEYHFLAASTAAATGEMPRYARVPSGDHASQAFHRRIWQRFFAGTLASKPPR